MKSWKTTLGGIGMLASGVGLLVKIIETKDFGGEKITAALSAISGGIGLLFARDNNVSSEQAGIKPTTPTAP